jgi:hypothetical protein
MLKEGLFYDAVQGFTWKEREKPYDLPAGQLVCGGNSTSVISELLRTKNKRDPALCGKRKEPFLYF